MIQKRPKGYPLPVLWSNYLDCSLMPSSYCLHLYVAISIVPKYAMILFKISYGSLYLGMLLGLPAYLLFLLVTLLILYWYRNSETSICRWYLRLVVDEANKRKKWLVLWRSFLINKMVKYENKVCFIDSSLSNQDYGVLYIYACWRVVLCQEA